MQLVLCTLVLSSVVSLSAALVCQNGQNYIKIIKKSTTSAAEESFTISDGSTVLVQSVTFTNNAEQTFEYCVTQNTNSQYSLEMKDSWGDSWTNGSYMEIRGIYENIFFKNFMADKVREQYSLSLYYPIMKTSQWKMTTGAASGWTQYSFGDSSWTTVTLGSVTSQLSGTQYFRKTFSGVSGMAAYETRLNYRYGIVAYLNGAEVYRDNMPEGAIADSTPSSGEYSEASFRGFVRPGKEVESSQSVLAVELHFTTASNNVDFDAFMALLTPTVPNSPCYAITEGYTTTATNSAKMMDMSKSTYAGGDTVGAEGLNIDFSFSDMRAYVNGLRIWPYSSPIYGPKVFTWGGKNSGTDYNTVMTINGMTYTANVDNFAYGYFYSSLYKDYRLHVTSTATTTIRLFEFYPMVCTVGVPQNVLYEPASYTYNAYYDTVSIRPLVTEFTACTISPAAPAGLTFDAATCTLSGKATAGQAMTTYTVTSTVNGQTYTGTFSLALNVCNDVMVDFRRVYKTSPAREAFSVQNSAGTVVYSVDFSTTQKASATVDDYVCLPQGQYSVTLSATTTYWIKDSFLYVNAMINTNELEYLMRARYDANLALETTRHFSTEYPVPYQSQWFYKMNEVPANWYGSDTSGWEQSTMGSYPAATSNIQLYKKTFNVASLQNYAGVVLTLRYKFGCVIYLNNYEVFRNGVVGDLSTSSVTENIYTDTVYHHVSLPIKTFPEESSPSVNYIQQGTNTIAIAIVSTTSTRTSFFDCAVRLMSLTTESRVLDGWSASATGITGTASNVFSDYYINTVYYSTCANNNLDVVFSEDRREWISAIVLQLHYTQTTQLPGQFVFKARNKADEEWTTLKTVTGMVWSQKGQAKTMYLANNKPYNQYRFENFATGNPSSCYWKFSRIDLQSVGTSITVPDLQYLPQGQTLEIFKDIEMGEVYSNSEFIFDYTVTPAFPEGILLDANTGMISGTTHVEAGTASYTISAKKLSGETTSTVLTLTVAICTGGRSLITLVARSDSNPSQCGYKLYEGKGTSGTVKASLQGLSVSSGLNYGDFCVSHNIYTLEILDSSSNGWTNPAGYYLTVDVGEMKFEMGQVPSGVASVSTMFSSYLPFQVNYDDWTYLKDAEAPADWNSVSFTPSNWATGKAATIGKNSYITAYVRREFTIPSLEDYSVLNVRVKYAGGIMVYFNGRKVARFNLADNFDKDTQSIIAYEEPVFSQFHAILNMVGATTAKNVIAFEVHRPKDTSSERDVVFDATGIFGVNDCSIALDTYSAIDGTKPTSGTLENFFDLTPVTYGYLPNTVGSYMEWTVENLEGTRFNSYAWQTIYARTNWGFSLYGRYEEGDAYTAIVELVGQSTLAMRRVAWSGPVGSAGFRQFKFEIDSTASATVSFNANFFQYCKPSGVGACPAVGDYPAVGEGEISPSSCPDGFRGYSYRTCTNGQLGEVQTDKCEYLAPQDLVYTHSTITFVIDVASTSGVPSYKNVITRFFMSPSTPLPDGLTIDEKTGEITGNPTAPSEGSYTIHGENPKGATFVEVSIIVRKGQCLPEGVFERTDVGEIAEYPCSNQGNYVGTQKRACVLGEKDGVWQKASGYCISVATLIIVVFIVVVLVLVLVFILVRKTKKTKAVGGVKNKKVAKKAPSAKAPKKEGKSVKV